MITVLAAVKAHLEAAGLDVYDGRPKVTPPGDYVLLIDRAPLTGGRMLNRHLDSAEQITVYGVSRDRDRCRAILRRALALLDGWRPIDTPATSPLTRYDASDVISDGPPDDVRHSQSVILRCSVPRGTAPTPQ